MIHRKKEENCIKKRGKGLKNVLVYKLQKNGGWGIYRPPYSTSALGKKKKNLKD